MFIQKIKSFSIIGRIGLSAVLLSISGSFYIVISDYINSDTPTAPVMPTTQSAHLDTTNDPKGVLGARTNGTDVDTIQGATNPMAPQTVSSARTFNQASPAPSITPSPNSDQVNSTPEPDTTDSGSPTPNQNPATTDNDQQQDSTICTSKIDGCLDESNDPMQNSKKQTVRPL